MLPRQVSVTLAILTGATTALAQCPPARPSSLNASRGVHCNSIVLDWLDVSGANNYNIYRNTSNNYSGSSLVGTALFGNSEFTDVTVLRGERYYYWVTAQRNLCLPANRQGPPSSVASGWRAQPPSAPIDVQASDGGTCNGIRVSWDPAPVPLGGEVANYRIYRNTVNVYLTADDVGTVRGDETSFFDTSAEANTAYHYWVRAENSCGNDAGDGDQGIVTSVGAPPPNDTCQTAQPVTGGQYIGTTSCAMPGGTSDCGQSNQSPDVWYSFTAMDSGTLRVETCTGTPSATFDTVLSVYSGCPGVIANEITCNDDNCGFQSAVELNVEAGEDYLIRVAGYEAGSGNFVLTVTPPGGACYADCDGNTMLDVFDFLCFQDAFVRGDPYANCDGNATMDVFDFLCFQDAFTSGCP